MKTRKQGLTRFTMPAHCCSFGKDGTQLIAAADDCLAKVLDPNGSEKKTVRLDGAAPQQGTLHHIVARHSMTRTMCQIMLAHMHGCKSKIRARAFPGTNSSTIRMAAAFSTSTSSTADPDQRVLFMLAPSVLLVAAARALTRAAMYVPPVLSFRCPCAPRRAPTPTCVVLPWTQRTSTLPWQQQTAVCWCTSCWRGSSPRQSAGRP